MLIVEPSDPRAPGATALLQASHAMMLALFPPEDNYYLEIEELCRPDIHFFTARDAETVLGTGALSVKDGYGEVKSMFTAPQARGKGVAAAILRRIEDQARALALPMLKLETAAALDSALRLYRRCGFVECGIFGDYRANHNSVYMEKPLT